VAKTEAQLLVPGATLAGRYEVVRCIKAGGMGAVYEVLDQETRRRRAVKTMLPSFVSDPDLRARFRLEATVAADVVSEHIVEVFDAGVDSTTGLPFLVMELLRGESLGAILAHRTRLPAPEVVRLLHQASLALARTHAAGIVHRDLKPENLFVTTRDDGTPRLKVLDFGIAKVVAESGSANTTRNLGTPLYMSPEQFRGDGDIGPRADIYSLGQIAFTLLAGAPYWEPESRRSGGIYAMLLKVMEGPREPASERARKLGATLPTAFDSWFRRATALDEFERFESVSEFVEKLAEALGESLPRPAPATGADDFAPARTSETHTVGALAFAQTMKSGDGPKPERASPRQENESMGAVSSNRAASPPRGFRLAAGVGLVSFVATVALLAGAFRFVSRDPVPAPADASALAPAATLVTGDSTGAPPLAGSLGSAQRTAPSVSSGNGLGEPAPRPSAEFPPPRPQPRKPDRSVSGVPRPSPRAVPAESPDPSDIR
jgi:eukaryotic-like serine/threonine-protein kinase